VAQLSTDGQPQVLFYMLGTVVWSYFAACFVQTAGTFVANAGLFGKVYFPRLVVPVATVLANLITLAIQLLQFAVIAALFVAGGYAPAPSLWILATPALVALMAGLGLGMGLAVSSLTTRYRDLQYVVTFGTPLLMYTTPIIYPLSSVPAKYRLLALANPMTPIVEAFRYAFLGSGTVSLLALIYAVVVTGAVLLLGVALFNRTERNFMDTV
jgi:lipopolysaccharide transport system permease protein